MAGQKRTPPTSENTLDALHTTTMLWYGGSGIIISSLTRSLQAGSMLNLSLMFDSPQDLTTVLKMLTASQLSVILPQSQKAIWSMSTKQEGRALRTSRKHVERG